MLRTCCIDLRRPKLSAIDGCATEAEEAGATLKMIQGALTHEDERTSLRLHQAPVRPAHRRCRRSSQRASRGRNRGRNGVRTGCQNHVRIAIWKVRRISELVGRSERI